ncbi:hypothetical protein Taro_036368 [Colocasia esculenta]|uniref:Uncharacterized protein n=1 Tax=Colocasia esculenta TaxID=4460 RepID=A0A843W9J3_COLES|nr:hypothetical protein [Colocasia esculenta]
MEFPFRICFGSSIVLLAWSRGVSSLEYILVYLPFVLKEDLVGSRVFVSLRVEGRPRGIQGVVIPLRVVKRRPAVVGCLVWVSQSFECHGKGQLVCSHCLALYGSGTMLGGQAWDRSLARLRLVVVFVHVSHSDGRGDLDSWSNGKTPVGAPDHWLVEAGLWLICVVQTRLLPSACTFCGVLRACLPRLRPCVVTPSWQYLWTSFAGAGACVRTVNIVPLVVSSVRNGRPFFSKIQVGAAKGVVLFQCCVRGERGRWLARASGAVDDGVTGRGLPYVEDGFRLVCCSALGRRRLRFRLHVFCSG